MSCPITISTFIAPPLPVNQAGTLVENGWNAAQNYANAAFTNAAGFLDELTTVSTQITNIPDIAVDIGTPQTILSGINLPDMPVVPTDLAVVLPAAPAEPMLTDVPALSLPDAPTFAADLPAVNLNIAPPDPLAATVPADPTLIDVILPDEPAIVLPDVPTLASLNIPAAPTINIPQFSAVLPDAPMNAPDTTFAFTEPGYASTLLDALKARLLEWVNGASTGIEPAVEQAMWDRARVREDINSARALGEVSRAFAARGFTMPPGAMLKATMEAVQETIDRNSSLSRDVAIKQADLEQSNRRFAFEQSWQVESGLITYANQVAQRAFDVARFTLQAGIDVFNAIVNRYNAQVQAYGVQATVFKTLIDAELSKLEVYKAELEGQRLIGEINTQLLEIYKARLDGVNLLIQLYNGRIQAANTQASINKTIIDGFVARVQAYDSLVRAKASEYDAYATQIKAEVSKVDVFRAEADAYTSQVQGYSALVNARVQENEAAIKVNQELPLEVFKQRVGVFGELVKAEGERVGALADVYRAEGSVYQANASAQAARAGAESEQYKAETSLLLGAANATIEAAKANLSKITSNLQVLVEAIRAGAQVSAQLAASALSSVNLSGSISDHYGVSLSESASYSSSHSTSQSSSCSDTYSHSE